MTNRLISLFVAACLPMTVSAQQAIPQFKAGDKVALVGDSITHGGHYHSYIWLYYMTRFPEMPLTIYNCGVGGDTAGDILNRWEYDVQAKNPTYITLTFGMNDTGYADVYNLEDTEELAKARVESSLGNFAGIVDAIEKNSPDASVVMIGGSPYDETSRKDNNILHGKNSAITEIIEAQRKAAVEHNWGFVDFNAPMVELARKIQAADSAYSFCPQDRIHPDKDGQMVMAWLFLKAQGLAGRKVAAFEVNARKRKAVSVENCSISAIDGDREGISFDYLAKALPYPCDSISEHGWGNINSQRDAMKIIPFMEEFNQEVLKVVGLDEGEYVFSIDGQPIDKLSSAELAEGVNMACYTNTPQYRQASMIMYLNEERLEIEKRFREYVWMEFNMFRNTDQIFADNWKSIEMIDERAPKDWFVGASNYWYRKSYYPEIREVWQNYIDDIVEKIYSVNKPVVHRITLTAE